MDEKLKHFESLFKSKNQELLDFEESFIEIRELLRVSNRDNSRIGRINEFTGSVINELFAFTEFVDKVIKCEHDEINSDTFEYFEKLLKNALADFIKLKNLINKMNNHRNNKVSYYEK